MRASRKIANFGRGSKALSGLLLLALVLTPACSLICQAQVCQTSPTTKQDLGCHHKGIAAARQHAGLTAAVSGCGVQEVVFALPTPANKWNLSNWSAVRVVFDQPLPVNSSSEPCVRLGKLDTRTGRSGDFHRSIVSQFSFDFFVFLRV
jgi:hypothetical protein